MRILLVLITLGLAVVAGQSEAQTSELKSICQPASERGTWPAIWRMADEDTEMHFFGTVHIVPKCVEWRSPQLQTIVRQEDIVYREVDTSLPAKQALAPIAANLALPDEGMALGQYLSERDIERLAEFFEVPQDQLRHMLAGISHLERLRSVY